MFVGLPEVQCLRCQRKLDCPFEPCPVCLAEDGVHVNGSTAPSLSAVVSGTDELAAEVLPPGIEARPPTPLTRLDRWGAACRIRVSVKDERLNPSFSYKDRLAEVAAVRAREAGADTLVVASSGNHGAAVARAATAAGLRAIVVTTASVPPAMLRLITGCGGQLIVVPAGEDRWRLVRAGMEFQGWFPGGNFHNPPIGSNPFLVDGYQRIAWEMVEQSGGVPDWVAVPVGYGDGLSGIAKGFRTLVTAGLIAVAPRMLAVETSGTLVRAARTGNDQPSPGDVLAPGALSIDCPRGTYQALHAVRASGGRAVTVSDDQVFGAQSELSRCEGAYHELASAAGFAGVRSAVENGVIGPMESVVVIGTSMGLKDQETSGVDDAVLDPVPDSLINDACAGRSNLDSLIGSGLMDHGHWDHATGVGQHRA